MRIASRIGSVTVVFQMFVATSALATGRVSSDEALDRVIFSTQLVPWTGILARDCVTGEEWQIHSPVAANSIAVDATHDRLFWADDANGRIWESDTHGEGVRELLSGLSHPTGLAIDTVNNVLYWGEPQTYSVLGPPIICRLDLRTGGIEKIAVPHLQKVERIQVDPVNEVVYFLDVSWGAIGRMSLNGTTRYTPLSTNGNITDFVIDLNRHTLYCVAGDSILRRPMFEGSEHEVVVQRDGISHGTAVLLTRQGNAVVWQDRAGITEADSENPSQQEVVGPKINLCKGIAIATRSDCALPERNPRLIVSGLFFTTCLLVAGACVALRKVGLWAPSHLTARIKRWICCACGVGACLGWAINLCGVDVFAGDRTHAVEIVAGSVVYLHSENELRWPVGWGVCNRADFTDTGSWAPHVTRGALKYRRPLRVSVPLWMLVASLLLPLAWYARMAVRMRTGRCTQCGYQYQASSTSVCSECGWDNQRAAKAFSAPETRQSDAAAPADRTGS